MLQSCEQKSFSNTEIPSADPWLNFVPPTQNPGSAPDKIHVCIMKTKRIVHISACSPFDVHVKLYMYYSYRKGIISIYIYID